MAEGVHDSTAWVWVQRMHPLDDDAITHVCRELACSSDAHAVVIRQHAQQLLQLLPRARSPSPAVAGQVASVVVAVGLGHCLVGWLGVQDVGVVGGVGEVGVRLLLCRWHREHSRHQLMHTSGCGVILTSRAAVVHKLRHMLQVCMLHISAGMARLHFYHRHVASSIASCQSLRQSDRTAYRCKLQHSRSSSQMNTDGRVHSASAQP